MHLATLAMAFGIFWAGPSDEPRLEAGDAAGVTAKLLPARARLLLGTESEVPVTVEIAGDGAAAFMPVRALANVGRLELPQATGVPGRFSARYFPPTDRFPQVALLVVEVASSAGLRLHVSARIALEGSTVVPFHTNPGTSVTMRVAERLFGPAIADRQGHVDIPIQVPPGITTGVARAVDHSGAARETSVDLQLPLFPRVLVLAPSVLEVGSFAEVPVLSVEPDGSPSPAANLMLGASDGLVHPLDPKAAGEARFLFEAPHRVGAGAVALTATTDGPTPSRADLAVPLKPGPPARLLVAATLRRLIIGSSDVSRVAITARDRFGNPTSIVGVEARIDGEPRPLARHDAGEAASLVVPAPTAFDGREWTTLEVALGSVRATEDIRLVGGAPARLSMAVGQARIIADGQQSAELRVEAVDRNGTPTVVPGLSWDTPEGRVRHVRVPRDGQYIAEYVPDRTREPHRQQVAVMASSELRADASLEVVPPPVRLVAGVRAGLFTNFGHAAGPAAFMEALRPVSLRSFRVQVGLMAGYLHADLSTPVPTGRNARLLLDQVPLMVILRRRLTTSARLETAADLGAGACLAAVRLYPGDRPPTDGSAASAAFTAGAEMSVPLRPGRLLIGLRYLYVALGETSQGDRIASNSAGLIGDIGYKMTF